MIVIPTNNNGVPLEPIPSERPAVIIGSQNIMLVFDDINEYLNYMNPPTTANPEIDSI